VAPGAFQKEPSFHESGLRGMIVAHGPSAVWRDGDESLQCLYNCQFSPQTLSELIVSDDQAKQRQPHAVHGRGSAIRPPNRFTQTHLVPDWEQLDDDDVRQINPDRLPTQFLPDASKSIIAENNSPDVGFHYSINPYRGCEHGCAYCYARPTHELLGMDAGLDFETKVLVKHDAAALLRAELARPSWSGETIAISGVTDCYQPAERRFRLTRALIEVLLEARQPTGIITKNALVLRDLDLLAPMAALRLVHVTLSITTLDAQLARCMEPRTSSPPARLRAIAELSAAGVPTSVMVAPIVPGVTDREVPAILRAARDAGAQSAGYVLLRLPLSVQPVFLEWLARHYPTAKDKVESLVRDTRGGKLYQSQWGSRQRGSGPYADQVAQTFRVFARKYGLDRPLPEYDHSQFRPPLPQTGQLRLF
jgi:DNA repair photolyase